MDREGEKAGNRRALVLGKKETLQSSKWLPGPRGVFNESGKNVLGIGGGLRGRGERIRTGRCYSNS